MNNMPIKMFRTRCFAMGKYAVTRMQAAGMLLVAVFVLCGMGASAQVTLTNNGPLTLTSGTFGPFNLIVTPTGSYSGTVIVGCANLPTYAYCVYPNASQVVSVSTGTATTVPIIVNTSQVNQYQSRSTGTSHRAAQVAMCAMLLPSGVLLLAFRKRRRKGFGGLQAMLALTLLVSLGALSGCGSTTPHSTPAGTYTFTVSASLYASSLAVSTTTVTLIVK